MTDYAESTHNRYWMLESVENVNGHRAAALERSNQVATCDGSSGDLTGLWRQQSADSQVRVLEEEAVVRHFCCQIQLACGCLSNRAPERPPINTRTWRVTSTACAFLQRFYLNNSVISHDPRIMVMACILLAGKVEESNVSMRELHRLHDKCKPEEILDAELSLMRGINYHLKVFHPQSMIVTLVADLKRTFAAGQPNGQPLAMLSELTRDWHTDAERVVDLLQLTTACLSHPPLDAAVSALLATQPPALPFTLESYLSQRFGAAPAKALLGQCSAILALLPAAKACAEGVEAEAAHAALKRLKLSPLCAWSRHRSATTKKPKVESGTSD